jgi:hypothetical protein
MCHRLFVPFSNNFHHQAFICNHENRDKYFFQQMKWLAILSGGESGTGISFVYTVVWLRGEMMDPHFIRSNKYLV